MPMRFLKYLVLAAPLALAACGDGWEMTRTEQFPYGNQRTAGTGVAYVRAKLLPKKELNLDPAPPPVEVPPAPPMMPQENKTPDPIKEIQDMFREKQIK